MRTVFALIAALAVALGALPALAETPEALRPVIRYGVTAAAEGVVTFLSDASAPPTSPTNSRPTRPGR